MNGVLNIIRETCGFFLRFSGIAWIIRSLFARNKVLIVVYHCPEQETFRKHMQYLSKRYRFISLERLVRAIRDKDWSDIPPKALVLNCDDGFKTNYGLLEVFKEFNIRPTIYLCSEIVGTHRHFWWGDKQSVLLKSWRNLAKSNLDKESLCIDCCCIKEHVERQAVDILEIEEMALYVDFGSHTQFHPILALCDDKRCWHEIMDSKTSLQSILNRPVEHFAYPNGDYGEREIENVKKCGYKSARTLDVGWNGVTSDPYKLKAIGITDNASLNVLAGQLTGFFSYFRYLRHGSLRGRRPPYL